MRWSARIALLPAILFAACPASNVRADGLAFKKGRDTSQWRPLAENEQLAAIHHAAGIQRMLLAIAVEMTDDERAAWVFPVRGPAEAVQIDIAERFPQFHGSDPRMAARRSIETLTGMWRVWALPPLLILQFPTLRGGVASVREVDKHGLHVEVVRADSAEAFAKHLAAKDVHVADAALETLRPYFNAEYALVVVWIAAAESLFDEFPNVADRWQVAGRWPCVWVQFPTPVPYFPLRPTAAYGNKNIPVRLYATGLHRPVVEGALASELEVRHYAMGRSTDSGLAALLGAPPAEGFEYTLISARVPANQYTHDLSLVPTQPAGWAYARFVQERIGGRGMIWAFVIGLFTLSYISGGLTGLIVFRRWSRPALLGAYNAMTIVALLIALRNQNLAALRRPNSRISDRSLKREFALGFVAIYILLTILVGTIAARPLA